MNLAATYIRLHANYSVVQGNGNNDVMGAKCGEGF